MNAHPINRRTHCIAGILGGILLAAGTSSYGAAVDTDNRAGPLQARAARTALAAAAAAASHRQATAPGQTSALAVLDPELAACCTVTGFCSVTTGQACSDFDGGSDCPGGEDCIPTHACDVLSQDGCAGIDGVWLGTNAFPPPFLAVADCTGDPCAVGACCTGPSQCNDTTLDNAPACIGAGGEYYGIAGNNPCQFDPCTALAVPNAPLAEAMQCIVGECGDPTGSCTVDDLCECTSDNDCWDLATCINSFCYVPKNRYISFQPNNTAEVAFRVKWIASSTFTICPSGLANKWVQVLADDPTYAELTDTPKYRVWNEAVVHIGDIEIVPASTYTIEAIERYADITEQANYSAALTLPTVPPPTDGHSWGDVVGLQLIGGFRPPDGSVDIEDIWAMIRGFQGHQDQAHLTWMNIMPQVPDRRVNIRDILVFGDAEIRGQAYPGASPPCAGAYRGELSNTTELTAADVSQQKTRPSPQASPGIACRLLDSDLNPLPRVCSGTTWQLCTDDTDCPASQTCSVSQAMTGDELTLELVLTDMEELEHYQTDIKVTQKSGEGEIITPDCVTIGTGLEIDNLHRTCVGTGRHCSADSDCSKVCDGTGQPCELAQDCSPGVDCILPKVCSGGANHRLACDPGAVCTGGLGCAACALDFVFAVGGYSPELVCESLVISATDGGPSDIVAAPAGYLGTYSVTVPETGEGSIAEITIERGEDGKGEQTILFKSGMNLAAQPSVAFAIADPCATLMIAFNCNGNETPDAVDISSEGNSPDCNGNGFPDECEIDSADGGTYCNTPDCIGCPEECDPDCNDDKIPDSCNIGVDYDGDCQEGDCDTDCHYLSDPGETPGHGVPDQCDILEGDGWGKCNPAERDCSEDCQSNHVPDECELEGNDCQPDSVPDICQLEDNDCQPNNIPDDCELLDNDCQPDGLPDDCQLQGNDCQAPETPGAGIPDDCDIQNGPSCNDNDDDIPDECQVAATGNDTRCDLGVCYDTFPAAAGTDSYPTLEAVLKVQWVHDVLLDGSKTGLRNASGTETQVRRETALPAEAEPDTVPCPSPPNFPEGADGIYEVHTEILSMNLTSADETTVFNVGAAYHPDGSPSLGEIQGTCIDFPADAFFDVFFELTADGMTLHNTSPAVVRAVRGDDRDGVAGIPESPWAYILETQYPAVPLVDIDGVQRAFLTGVEFGGPYTDPLPTVCEAKPGIRRPVSFAVASDSAGLPNPPSNINAVRDSSTDLRDVTVYFAPNTIDGQTPAPDITNASYPALVGNTVGLPDDVFSSYDKIYSLSFGRDGTKHPSSSLAAPVLYFSVDPYPSMSGCSDVAREAAEGDGVAAADIYLANMVIVMEDNMGLFDSYVDQLDHLPPPCDAAHGNCLVEDHTALGLGPIVGQTNKDDLVALELGEFHPGVDLVYLTIAGNESQEDRATIYTYDGSGEFQRGNLSVFAAPAEMGLTEGTYGAGDVIDALALSDVGVLGVFDEGEDEVLFSLAPNSHSLQGQSEWTHGDIFYSTFDGSFRLFVSHDALGLSDGDNIDAIDVGSSIYQSDCNSNGINDYCEVERHYSPDDNPDDGLPDSCIIEPVLAAPSPYNFRKNRFIAFDANNTHAILIQVQVAKLKCSVSGDDCSFDEDCPDFATGERCLTPGGRDPVLDPLADPEWEEIGWVGAPCEIEAGTQVPVNTWHAMVLRNMPGTPGFEYVDYDGVALTTVFVSDCEIMPRFSYGLRSTVDGQAFQRRLVVGTIREPVKNDKHWADVVGERDGVTREYTEPNQRINVDDVQVMIVFLNAKSYRPHVTVLDLSDEVINYKINADDLQMVMRAFNITEDYPPLKFQREASGATHPRECPDDSLDPDNTEHKKCK